MKEVLYDWLGYNTEIFYFLNHIGNTWILPQFFYYLSRLFNIENFAAYYIGLCGICYWHVFVRMRATSEGLAESKTEQEKRFWLLYSRLIYIGICYAVFGLIYAALKFSVNLPRPFCSLPASAFKTIMNTADERCMSSFPSSHSGLAFMVTLLAWRYFGTYARLCAIGVTAAVAFSRIALAMHYPADILYSYLIVLMVLCMSGVIFRLFECNIGKYVGKKILQNLVQ